MTEQQDTTVSEATRNEWERRGAAHMAQLQPPKKQPWFRRPAVMIPLCALVLGIVLGSAVKPTPDPVQVPGPERIVNHTEVKEKEVTPAACLKALDLSEEAFGYAAEAMGFMSDAMTAAGNLDLAAITKANAGLDKTTPKMTALKDPMQLAKAECRAAGS